MRDRTGWVAAVVLALGLLSGGAANDNRGDVDREHLQGNWRVVSSDAGRISFSPLSRRSVISSDPRAQLWMIPLHPSFPSTATGCATPQM